jgi:hypothetical protein
MVGNILDLQGHPVFLDRSHLLRYQRNHEELRIKPAQYFQRQTSRKLLNLIELPLIDSKLQETSSC